MTYGLDTLKAAAFMAHTTASAEVLPSSSATLKAAVKQSPAPVVSTAVVWQGGKCRAVSPSNSAAPSPPSVTTAQGIPPLRNASFSSGSEQSVMPRRSAVSDRLGVTHRQLYRKDLSVSMAGAGLYMTGTSCFCASSMAVVLHSAGYSLFKSSRSLSAITLS